MNNSPFDEHIKKQLGNIHPEVPTYIWENIVAKKEKRAPAGLLFRLSGNRIKFILSLFIVSASGVLLVNYFYKNHSSNPAELNLISAPVTKATKTTNNAASYPASQNSTTRVAVNNTLEKNENRTSYPAVAENRWAGLTMNEKSEHAGKRSAAGNNIEVETADAISSVLSTPAHNKIPGKTKSRPAAGENKDEDAGDPAFIQAKNNTVGFAAKMRLAVENAGLEYPAVTAITLDNSATSNNRNDILLANYFLLLNVAPVEKIFSFNVKNISLTALTIPCPESEKNAAGNKRYIEIYGGPDYAFRSFNDTANSAYLQKRKESTRFSSAFSLGLRYTRVFNNAVSFRTGLNYSQVNEKFSYVQGHIVQLVYLINDQGDTTGSYASTGTRYKTTYNRYKTVDIPLIFGYEMGNSRLHTNINAGLIVNAYSWQKGDVLDTNDQPVNITTGKSRSPYQFKTNVGIGFTGGVSFYYKLTNRLHILAEPWLRYNFSAANKAEITLKQKYTTTGVRIGLRIDL